MKYPSTSREGKYCHGVAVKQPETGCIVQKKQNETELLRQRGSSVHIGDDNNKTDKSWRCVHGRG